MRIYTLWVQIYKKLKKVVQNFSKKMLSDPKKIGVVRLKTTTKDLKGLKIKVIGK